MKSMIRWSILSSVTLFSVLLLGYKFGLPINKLLFEEIKSNNISVNSSKGSNFERPKVDYKKLQQSMKSALTSTELVSIKRLSKQFGVKRDTIKKHFPKEYDLLKQKNIRQKEEKALERETQIRDTMIFLNERGIFPNKFRVRRALGKDVIITERYRKIWENTLHELGYMDINGSV